MSDQTIDSLNLQISASTQQAVNSINKLLSSLKGLNGSLKNISSSGVRNYSKEIGRVATSLQSLNNIKATGIDEVTRKLSALASMDLSKLQKQKVSIDLDIKGGDNADKLQYSIQKTIDEMDINTDKISQRLIDSFGLDRSAAQKLKKQMRDFVQGYAQAFDGDQAKYSASYYDNIDKSAELIIKSGKVARSSIGDDISYMQQEWQAFYDYFNKHKIYVSDALKSGVGKSEFNELLQSGLRYITRDSTKGINLNANWDDLFGNIFQNMQTLDGTNTPFKEITNDAEQLKVVLESLNAVSEKLKNVDISNLSQGTKEYKDAVDLVWSQIVKEYDSLGTKTKESLQSNMQVADGQLPIDIKINQDKIVRDIRNAVNKAAELKYNAVKVNLNVDTQSIKDSITQKLSEIDSGQLTGAADAMQKLSTSLSSMGNINYKDNGLNTIINSLNRLIKTDMGSFDTGKLANIITELSKLSAIPDVSSSVNRFVSAIAKLASAGNNVSLSANALPKLGTSLKTVTTDMSKVTDVSASMNMFVSSISKLASAGNRTGQTAEQLTQLGDGLKNFMASIQDAPNVSENILRMTEALGNIASSGSKASSFFGSGSGGGGGGFNSGKLATVSNVVSKLTTNINRLAQSGKNGLSRLVQWFRQIGNSSGSLQTATYNLKNLFATIVGYRGISGILNSISGFFSSSLEGKGILEIGSDIAEIENVVDVSFGSMADKAYEFAESATEAYGLSELAAKEYSGTMMAMLKSSGLGGTQEMKAQAAEMSTTLAGLAGDMASFFNIDTDTAFYKIRAGISGKRNLAPRYRNVA